MQESFEQQRGDSKKGDSRELVKDEVVPSPETGAKSINKKDSIRSSFYGDQ